MRKRNFAIIIVFFIYLTSVIVLNFVNAVPDGANVVYVTNTSKNATSPDGRTDDKGFIHTIILSGTVQNNRWKAYVGNVSGTLVLRDADDYSIYEWPTLSSPDGQVFITRNDTVNWNTIRCANETAILAEQSSLGHSATAGDNINNTFLNRIHEQFVVGTTTIVNSTCKSTATWVNNTEQTLTESSLFPEVLLMDIDLRLVFTTRIDQDTSSYRNGTTNTTYDFQAILPDLATASTSTYYFYLEI